jgi:hypothetical protein
MSDEPIPAFESTGETFRISGRGTVYVCKNTEGRKNYAHLVGRLVLIDGIKRTVAAVEHLMTNPPRVSEHVPILVADEPGLSAVESCPTT